MLKIISKNNIYAVVGFLIMSLLVSSSALAQEGFSGSIVGPSDAQQKGMEKAQQMEQKGAEMQKQGEEKQLKGLKQGAGGMERALKQFENNFAKLEKGGTVISDSTREKLRTIRTNIETIKSAKTSSDVEGVDQEALQVNLSSLGDEIGSYQKMMGLKKMLASMNRGVASFEKQLTKFQSQGVTVPVSVSEDFDKLKAGLKAINDAKTPQELDATNPDDLGDLMTKVNESRPILEMAAKWPRVLKQADQQLNSFNKQLSKTQALVSKLKSQNIDVSAEFATLQADVVNLKIARDAADVLMKEGKSDEAFPKIEDEFFNELDNTGEHQRVIQNLANLNRFNVEFKRGMADAQKTIKSLSKRKIDTASLQALYDQAFAKGNEISLLIKATPIDEEAVRTAMDELESFKQDFLDKADDLSGGQQMLWEKKEPAQFQSFALPKDFQKTVTQVIAPVK